MVTGSPPLPVYDNLEIVGFGIVEGVFYELRDCSEQNAGFVFDAADHLVVIRDVEAAASNIHQLNTI